MTIFFACLFGAGMVCFWLFTLDFIQGRIKLSTTWNDLTIHQWILFVGSFFVPIGLFGAMAIK